MSDKKITELDLATPEETDVIPFVDISDTTMGLSGTTKKATKADLKGEKGAQAESVAFVGNDIVFTLDDASTVTLVGAKTDLKGETGNGIASIVKTGTVGLVDTYTITYDDSTTTTFDVTNGEDGDNAYVYIAYASDDTGTDFTTTFNPLLDYIAIKSTTTSIPSPSASDFTGLWKNYKGEKGDTGDIGIDWQGAWSAGTYTANQAVSHNGSSWIATTTTTEEPSISATDWDLIALKGTDGAGSGDVLGPATNTANYIPQWDGANSKTLKDGLGLDTDLSSVSANHDTVPSAKATKAMGDLKLAIASKATQAEVATGTDDAKYTTPLAVAPYGNQSIYRQAIINGNFDVWQRGTSISDFTTAKYTADRWTSYCDNTATTISRQTASLAGSLYCIRLQRTAGNTTENMWTLNYGLETLESIKYRGQKVTLSFYIRAGANYSATSSQMFATIYSGTGTDQSPWSFTNDTSIVETNATITTSWQKVTVTTTNVIADTVTQLRFGLAWAPKGTAGAADYLEIAQVQLNAGSVALPFQPKSYAEELRDCQRYCYGITTVSATEEVAQGMAVSTTVSYPSITLPVTMRTLPTVTVTAADWQLDDGINTPTDVKALVIDDLGFSNTRKVVLKASAASGLTAHRPYYLVGDGNAGRVLILSAEL